MADVFISYKREDRPVVDRLAANLSDLGLDVWYDWALEPGEDWGERILREVRGASAIVVCWSPEAKLSSWVMREAFIGLERGVLVPVVVRDCLPPEAFAEIQSENLVSWTGEMGDARLRPVIRSLERLTGKKGLASNAILRAGGQNEVMVALLRGLLVARARDGAVPFTYAEAAEAVEAKANQQGMQLGGFSQPALWGALDAIAEQNRRHREPPLAALVVDKDYGLPGRGYFQKHVFLDGLHDTLEQQVFARQLERLRTFAWSRDP